MMTRSDDAPKIGRLPVNLFNAKKKVRDKLTNIFQSRKNWNKILASFYFETLPLFLSNIICLNFHIFFFFSGVRDLSSKCFTIILLLVVSVTLCCNICTEFAFLFMFLTFLLIKSITIQLYYIFFIHFV